MVRDILDSKDSRLRLLSKPVKTIDKKITSLINDLKDTLIVQEDPEGIGLAAPQIGKNLRIFIMKPGSEITTIINPEILSVVKRRILSRKHPQGKKYALDSGKKIMEGCLSLPHYYGPITRAAKITIKYLDENGKSVIKTFEKLDSQIIQHEIDHLNGALFVDRLIEQKKPLYEYVDGEWEKVELL